MKWWHVGAGVVAGLATNVLLSVDDSPLGYLQSFSIATSLVAAAGAVILMALPLGRRTVIFAGSVVALIASALFSIPYATPLLIVVAVTTVSAVLIGLFANESWVHVPRDKS